MASQQTMKRESLRRDKPESKAEGTNMQEKI
jgi:hypothetical protein